MEAWTGLDNHSMLSSKILRFKLFRLKKIKYYYSNLYGTRPCCRTIETNRTAIWHAVNAANDNINRYALCFHYFYKKSFSYCFRKFSAFGRNNNGHYPILRRAGFDGRDRG